ncbi:MAG: FG-GAP repeat domain-containing protein, partial [Planctomycetota bacterium]
HLDIVMAIHGINNGALVYWGDGSGINWTSHTRINFSNGPQGLAIGDFNHDGHPDFAAACNYSATVVLVTYTSGRNFTVAKTWTEGDYPARLAATTFNGRTLLAVAAGDHYAAYEIDPQTLNQRKIIYFGDQKNVFGVAWGNFDWIKGVASEDGIPDLAFSETMAHFTFVGASQGLVSGGTYSISSNNDGLAFSDSKQEYFQGLTTITVPGDSRSYLVVADNQSSVLRTIYGPGTYPFSDSFVVNSVNMQGATGMNEAAVADFNGDGIPELISANNRSNNVSIVSLVSAGAIDGYPGNANAITTFMKGGLNGSVSTGSPVAMSNLLNADQIQNVLGQVAALQSGNAVRMTSGYQIRVPGTFVTANAASLNGQSGSYLTAWNLRDSSGHPIAFETAQQLFGNLGTGNQVRPLKPEAPLSAFNGAWFMPTYRLSGAATTPAEAFFEWGSSYSSYNNSGQPVPATTDSGVGFYSIQDVPPSLRASSVVVSDGSKFPATGESTDSAMCIPRTCLAQPFPSVGRKTRCTRRTSPTLSVGLGRPLRSLMRSERRR